jgi:putative endonuclease
MQKSKRFYVYIMAGRPGAAILYVGITGDIVRRVWEHKNRTSPGFTQRYSLTRLVYYEMYVYPDAAIAREKEIKGWRRQKKLALIESMNPRWEDLAEKWQDLCKPDPAVDCNEIPVRRARFAHLLRAGSRPAGESAGLRDDAAG